MANIIANRQVKEKSAILEMLKKTPIIQIVCEKSGISRATYYRWLQVDAEFAKQAETARAEGVLLINDLAQSKLIASIQDQNMTAIIFWLKSHDPAYMPKLELTTTRQEELTREEQVDIAKSLELAGIETLKTTKRKGANK